MKNCWRIRNDADIEQCLHKLNVDSNYIKILLEEDSDPIRYLNQIPTPTFIYICYENNIDKYTNNVYNHWGWFEEEYFNNETLTKYKYCGEINLREKKLKKLEEINGDFR